MLEMVKFQTTYVLLNMYFELYLNKY